MTVNCAPNGQMPEHETEKATEPRGMTRSQREKIEQMFQRYTEAFGKDEDELPWARMMDFWSEETPEGPAAQRLLTFAVLKTCNRYWIDITGGSRGFVLVKRANEDDVSGTTVRRVKWQEKAYQEFEKNTYRKFKLPTCGSVAQHWRDWPEARSATKYDMVGPMARPADILGDDVFNTYGGMAVSLEDARRNGDASDTGHGALFQRFVEDGLCRLEGKEVGHRLYQWLALIATRPGWRSNLAACVFGAGGAGRSMVANTMCRILGDTLSTSQSNSKVVLGDFNGVIKHRSLVVLEEVVLRDEASMNRMKDLIDGSRLSVRNLYSEATSFRNTGNYLINNNHTDSLNMAYEGVRKFLCIFTDNTCGFYDPEWAAQADVLHNKLNYRDVLARMIKVAEELPEGFEVSRNLPLTKGMQVQKKSSVQKRVERNEEPVKDWLTALAKGDVSISGLQWGQPVPIPLLWSSFSSMYKESRKVMEKVSNSLSLMKHVVAELGELNRPSLSHVALVKKWKWQEPDLLLVKTATYRCAELPSADRLPALLGVEAEQPEPVVDAPES